MTVSDDAVVDDHDADAADVAGATDADDAMDAAEHDQVWQLEQDTFMAGLICWSLLLALCTRFQLGTGYVPLSWVVFPVAARAIIQLIGASPLHNRRASGTGFVIMHLIGLLIPTLLTWTILHVLVHFFAPIIGRSGSELPPDAFIGAIIAVGLSILTWMSVSLVHLDPHWRHTRNFLLAVFLISLVAATQSTIYKHERPKRLFLQHVQRKWFERENVDIGSGNGAVAVSLTKTDAGIWTNPLDPLRLEPLRPLDKRFADAEYVACEGVVCGFPWYFPIHEMVNGQWYLPAEPPTESTSQSPLTVNIVREELTVGAQDGDLRRRLYFEVRGTDHMAVYVDATQGPLANWSFAIEAPDWRPRLSGHARRDHHFVFFGSGNPFGSDAELREEREWDFWLEIERERELRVSIAAHYFWPKLSRAMQEIWDALPDWITPIAWHSLHYNFKL